MVLNASEYDAAYFGDQSISQRHVAGYTNYLDLLTGKTWLPDTREEIPMLHHAINRFTTGRIPVNKSVLELGGAVGFYGSWALAKGIDWTVLDQSQWCFDHKVVPTANFILGDALTQLQSMRRNEYDVIFSAGFLMCIDEADVSALITEMNRVAKTLQIHVINENGETPAYNIQSMDSWKVKGFDSGTILISRERVSPDTVVV